MVHKPYDVVTFDDENGNLIGRHYYRASSNKYQIITVVTRKPLKSKTKTVRK